MKDWIEQAAELKKAGQIFAIVTVTETKGSTPRKEGTKLIVLPSGTIHGTIGGGQLESLVIEDALNFLREATSGTQQYPLCFKTGQCCGGAVSTFTEIFGVGPRLILFGAGHVGQAVCEVLQETPFQIDVVDQREEWLHHEKLDALTVRKHSDANSLLQSQVYWHKQNTFAVIMTHDHALDLELVEKICQLPARYIGLIGSTTKDKRFRMRLKNLGRTPDEIGRIRCPIGVKLSDRPKTGNMPKEIAISLAAEILQNYYD